MPAANRPLAAPLKNRNVGCASSFGILRDQLAIADLELAEMFLLFFSQPLEDLAPARVARQPRRPGVELQPAPFGGDRDSQRVAREQRFRGRARLARGAAALTVLARAEDLHDALARREVPRIRDFLDERFDVRAQELERLIARLADQVEVARMPVRMLEPEPALAEIDAARDAGVDHPLKGAIDRRAADAGVFAADEIDELIRADVPFLPEKNVDDEVAFAGAAAARRAEFLDELGR